MTLPPRYRAFLVFVAILPLSGCLFRTRTVERQMSTAPLKTATQAQLIDYINRQAAKVRSMNATVDIDTSVGGEKKGKVTDITEIRGYVLARKPSMLRMIGLLPVVRTPAFNMVSDGETFKLMDPLPKIVLSKGRNDVPTPELPRTPAGEGCARQYIYGTLFFSREIDTNERSRQCMDNDFELVAGPKGRQVQQPEL